MTKISETSQAQKKHIDELTEEIMFSLEEEPTRWEVTKELNYAIYNIVDDIYINVGSLPTELSLRLRYDNINIRLKQRWKLWKWCRRYIRKHGKTKADTVNELRAKEALHRLKRINDNKNENKIVKTQTGFITSKVIQ